LNTCNDYLYNYEHALQTSPNTWFTRRLYSVHTTRPQRAYDALKDPHSCHNVPTARCLTRCASAKPTFVLSTFKENVTAWRSRRLHSAFTAFPQRCWRLYSAHLSKLQLFRTLFKRCEDAALVWQVFYTPR